MVKHQIDRVQLAWAAGLFEGEGCFYMKRRGRNNGDYDDLYPHAVIVMTDRDVLETFRQIMGFGTIQHQAAPTERHKERWKWVAGTFEHFQQTVCYLWPWLHERRRTKATELMVLYHQITALRNSGVLGGRRRRRRVRE